MSLPAVSALHAMTVAELDAVRAFEAAAMTMPQAQIHTQHVFHAGMYARTICLPAKHALTGALIKVPTLVIISGDVQVFTGGEVVLLHGYNVLPGSAGRKQAFHALTDTRITMLFPTQAKTVEDAEREFTDEYEMLMSRAGDNDVIITGV